MDTRSYKAVIVPHTHWDRAWYVPFAEFHLSLIRMIDGLIETMEADPEYPVFCLDGQTVVLEDYLAVRPQMRDRLARLVASRRLWVGPWYVLPDEFLVSAEALVRNLLLGTRMANELGHAMRVGYEPDAFGHIAQLPQILRGFGFDTFVASRGIDWDVESGLPTEFVWRGPDGSAVLALIQKDGYTNMSRWGFRGDWGCTARWKVDVELALRQMEEACEKLKPFTCTGILLLNDGVDHAEHQPELPELLRAARARFPEYDPRVVSFEEYAEAVKAVFDFDRAAEKRGEFDFRYGVALRGTNSARMYLKQANQRCQDLLERYAEPLSAIAHLLGERSRQDELWHVWRTLLKNHPHDDICGCSVDQVHRDMENRFEQVEMYAKALARDGLRALGRSIDRTGVEGVPVVVFNPLGHARSGVVEFAVDLTRIDEPWATIALFDESGAPVPYELVDVCDMDWMEPVKWYAVRRFTVRTRLDVPPFGYRTVYARPGEAAVPALGVTASERGFENTHYRLEIASNGSVELSDKATGSVYRDLMVFEDMEDAGDEYSWSNLASSPKPITTRRSRAVVELLRQGPLGATWRIAHRMRVPDALNAGRTARSSKRVTLDVVTEVTCRADSPRIDAVTRVRNTARDHRLRVLFPAGVRAASVQADGHYGVIDRDVALPPVKDGVPPCPTQHAGRFCSVADSTGGLSVINSGLPEFEAVAASQGVTLAQTLFRSCGWLSIEGFPIRPLLAGPPLETPDAQCEREMHFEYAFMAHDGRLDAVVREAQNHNLPVWSSRCDIDYTSDLRQYPPCREPYFKDPGFVWAQPVEPVPRGGALPPKASMIDLGNPRLVLSAVRLCDSRAGLIVRFYNPGPECETAVLGLFRAPAAVFECGLDEARRTEIPAGSASVTLECPGYAAKTIEIVW